MTREYPAPGIKVRYDVGLCAHAAECVRGLPDVFAPGRKPWIDPSRASALEVAEVIRRCPSGALTYSGLDAPAEEPDRPTTITPLSWGPVAVRGDLHIGVRAASRALLCACGKSAAKPYCDNACR